MNLFYNSPDTFNGMQIRIVDAQQQGRTIRDVKGSWIRPKVPNKRIGRKGTRRLLKQLNPPHFIMLYRKPTDVLIFADSIIVATPFQAELLRRQTTKRW